MIRHTSLSGSRPANSLPTCGFAQAFLRRFHHRISPHCIAPIHRLPYTGTTKVGTVGLYPEGTGSLSTLGEGERSSCCSPGFGLYPADQWLPRWDWVPDMAPSVHP